MLMKFNGYTEKLSTNTGKINLVSGWHGSSEETCMKIAANNFLEPHELTKQTDPGYFGKGIYFTQFPSYGIQYVKNLSAPVLLLSWILMGKVYPVIERPSNDPADKDKTLLGKPCKQGFDSHYSITKKVTGMPCPMNEEPDGDELVVFSKDQILPRYLIFFRKTSPNPALIKQSTSVTIGAFGSLNSDAPLPKTQITKNSYVVIWIDDKFYKSDNNSIIRTALDILPKLHVEIVTSTQEAKVFITKNKDLLKFVASKKRLRIITNKYRENDGKEHAGEICITAFKGEYLTSQAPIMLLCSTTDQADYLHNRKKKIIVSYDIKFVLSYITFQKLTLFL